MLEAQGYVERGHMMTTAEGETTALGGDDSWVLIPTDSGILTAMGLARAAEE